MFNNNDTLPGDQTYQGLYNLIDNGLIGSNGPPNTILSTDSTGVVDFHPLLNAQIPASTISVDKINASGPLDSSHYLTGAGTWATVGSSGAISGSTIPNISITSGSGSLGTTKLYTWVLNDTIMTGSLVMSLTNFTTDSFGNFVFSLNNVYPLTNLSNRFIACSSNYKMYDGSSPVSVY